jgi:hypothetical protein
MMISIACADCARTNTEMGLKDGGCRPGCRNAFRAEPVADDLPGLFLPEPQRQPDATPVKRMQQLSQREQQRIEEKLKAYAPYEPDILP